MLLLAYRITLTAPNNTSLCRVQINSNRSFLKKLQWECEIWGTGIHLLFFVAHTSWFWYSEWLCCCHAVLMHMVRYEMPVIFSVLCPWQGKGSLLLTHSPEGKCEGRACWKCDMSWSSHPEGVRTTARNNTQVSSASGTCPVL